MPSPKGYTRLQIALHWGAALLIVQQYLFKDAIAAARATIGATNPVAANPGTIRGDLGMEVGRNLVHGSDSPENGEREASLFFAADELVSWDRVSESWIRE